MTGKDAENRTDIPDEQWMDRRDHRNRSGRSRGASKREWARERLMRDWYGRAQGSAEIRAHQRAAAPIERVVNSVLSKFRSRSAVMLDDLQNHWADIVGADVARYTAPVSIFRNLLRVEVQNDTWRFVLESERKQDIIKKVHASTGGSITNVALVAPGRTWRPRPRTGGDGGQSQ